MHNYMIVCKIKGMKRFKHRTFEKRLTGEHKFTVMERQGIINSVAKLCNVPVHRVSIDRITCLGASVYATPERLLP